MTISASMVKELRERTGSGLMDCKRALSENHGDIEKAIDWLRQKGLAAATKKAGRKASEGIIGTYVHMDKIGVMVEVNCETDFVARTDEFRSLVKDLAMHIAAASPLYLSANDVPEDLKEREREIYRAQVTNKPANIIEKIVEGKLEKFFSETCLLEQIFIKDTEQKQKIKDLITEKIAKLGENIVLRRFVRFQLGEGLQDSEA